MIMIPTQNTNNFFSSGLRQKVDSLMNTLWSGGVNNPMDSIEQISYLLFLRLLSEKDEQLSTIDKKYQRVFSGEGAKFAWGNFVTRCLTALCAGSAATTNSSKARPSQGTAPRSRGGTK